MSKKYDLIFLLFSFVALLFLFVFSLPVSIRLVLISVFSIVGFVTWIIGLSKREKTTIKGLVGLGLFMLDIIIVIWGIQSIIVSDNYNYAKKLIEVKVPRTAQLLEKVEDHGGFHGDGESYMVFQLSDKEFSQIQTEIEKNNNWKKMPLSGMVLQNSKFFSKEYYDVTKRVRDIPINLTEGFYYYSGNIDEYSENFTFSLLDIKNKILYILREDT